MKCNHCGAEVGRFDVHCSACSKLLTAPPTESQIAESLGWSLSPETESEPFAASQSYKSGDGYLDGAKEFLGALAIGLARGTAEGIGEAAKTIAAEEGLDSTQGMRKQLRMERALRNTRD